MSETLSTEEIEVKRTAWHSRRGMLELDVLLVPFAEQAFAELSREDKDRYLALLECEDPDLFTWFMEHKIPENAELARAVEMVREFIHKR